mmetsp:Transcript_27189/g.46320  ORF Transcript_27189/g.46320 Transcript_27189/m.46320 type:complete len:210 (+) Transcript_27189:46-675(+)
MIKKLTKKNLSRRQQDSQQTVIDHDELRPSIFNRENFLTNGAHREASTISDDGSDPPSRSPSSNSSTSTETHFKDNEGGRVRQRSNRVMIAFIRDGLEPGRKVRLNYPGGGSIETVIPPRSQWGFKNINGEPRPFFQPSDKTFASSTSPSKEFSNDKSSSKQDQRHPSISAMNASDNCTSKMICLCSPTLGVYDSTCPQHGTASHNGQI